MIAEFLSNLLFIPYIPGNIISSFMIESIVIYYINNISICILLILLTVYLTRIIKNKYKIKSFSLPFNSIFISFFFLLIPILNIIYPFILGLSSDKIKKHIPYIILWSIFSNIYLMYNLGKEYTSFSLITIIPIISLLLFTFNINNKFITYLFRGLAILIILSLFNNWIYEYLFWNTKI